MSSKEERVSLIRHDYSSLSPSLLFSYLNRILITTRTPEVLFSTESLFHSLRVVLGSHEGEKPFKGKGRIP